MSSQVVALWATEGRDNKSRTIQSHRNEMMQQPTTVQFTKKERAVGRTKRPAQLFSFFFSKPRENDATTVSWLNCFGRSLFHGLISSVPPLSSLLSLFVWLQQFKFDDCPAPTVPDSKLSTTRPIKRTPPISTSLRPPSQVRIRGKLCPSRFLLFLQRGGE